MLQPLMHVLNNQRIVLASGSPRRRAILENVDLKFEVIPSTFEENVDKSKVSLPQDYVLETARLKLEEVATRQGSQGNNKPLPDLLIGADTVVCLDSRIFEKPKDKEDAVSILSSLSGRTHCVYTGVILACPAGARASLPKEKCLANGLFNYMSFVECTKVTIAELTREIIDAYIETGEPMDKAGGFGIQKVGGTLVERVEGDYFNVVGFPLARFSKEMVKIFSNKT